MTTNPTTIKPLEILYKQADGVGIYMDVYLSPSSTPENPAPYMFWFHSGGLLMGTRKHVAPHHLRAPSEHNVTFISADYRLAPQFRMPAILSDCVDAIKFLQSAEFKKTTEGRVDTSRIILTGSSAGGWFSLLIGCGIGFEEAGLGLGRVPVVKGLIPIYPMTDLEDPFFKTKHRPVAYIRRIIGENRIVGDEEVQPFIDPDDLGSRASFAEVESARTVLYHYAVQEALVEELLLGDTGLSGSVFSIPRYLKGLPSPGSIPSIYLIHGDADGPVPVTQSREVAKGFKDLKHKDFTYEEVPGVDHLYDQEPEVGMEEMYKFVKRVFEM
ncbi:hypothetical protein GYMLUDRAFT_41247 [Collybiopsis luxurians FD-317 M1]|uniref:Unplaced genomic scaffold GYMLUscaffold_17, whole genome shotgun sequence n=1 Tax=Collybiopsis luxurians FD-317 M1 TaxID=944289 RepID=A0A0D0CJI9_9AGAR|nr:hypothetical protein GYMLUDRAFT_41247 [Collybiopsis luxurians FD-317 M1]